MTHKKPLESNSLLMLYAQIMHKHEFICFYEMHSHRNIQTFPKLPFPRRDKKLKSKNRITSWWMMSGCWTDTWCPSASEKFYT